MIPPFNPALAISSLTEAHPEADNVFFRCVEDSSDAIMISDRAGTLSYVNPAWRKLYGYSWEEAIGRSPRLLHSGIQAPSFYHEMWASILDPGVAGWKGELINKAKDGTLVPVLLSITPIRGNGDPGISGYMSIAVDLTQRKELETKAAQQDRLASLGLLASGLAHEIGTPLGVIRGRAELLLGNSDERSRKSLNVIVGEIDRISKIIRTLLRLSRGFGEARLEDVSPAEAAAEVLSLVSRSLREDRIDVRAEIPSDLRIRAESGRLEQVLLNLVLNSAHAIRQARAEGNRGPHLLLIEGKDLGDGQASLKVEDTGCGIAPENMRKLFKPFFTTKDVGEGTGLGLTIVAQLMREMNGRVSVRSRPGEGTAFTLSFAASPSAQSP